MATNNHDTPNDAEASIEEYKTYTAKPNLRVHLESIAKQPIETVRELFLLHQYHNIKIDFDNSDAIQSVMGYVRSVQRDNREFLYSPNRRQILGKKRELKQRYFLQVMESMCEGHGGEAWQLINSMTFKQMAYEAEELGFISFSNQDADRIKIAREEWQKILDGEPAHIPLPDEVAAAYEYHNRPDDDDYGEEDIPF